MTSPATATAVATFAMPIASVRWGKPLHHPSDSFGAQADAPSWASTSCAKQQPLREPGTPRLQAQHGHRAVRSCQHSSKSAGAGTLQSRQTDRRPASRRWRRQRTYARRCSGCAASCGARSPGCSGTARAASRPCCTRAPTTTSRACSAWRPAPPVGAACRSCLAPTARWTRWRGRAAPRWSGAPSKRPGSCTPSTSPGRRAPPGAGCTWPHVCHALLLQGLASTGLERCMCAMHVRLPPRMQACGTAWPAGRSLHC